MTPIQSITSLQISLAHHNGRKIDLTAIVVPRVTCDLPVYPVPFDLTWKHISDVPLADPGFGQPGRNDILLGVDIFVDVLLHGWRTGPPGSPVALETEFGWVLSGSTKQNTPMDQVNLQATTFYVSATSGDDVLCKFCEIEESPANTLALSLEERTVVRHFEANHHRNQGRFVIPMPRKPDAKPIGESRSQTVQRFLSLERSLNHKGQFQDFEAVVQEYLDLGHAEDVPSEDLDKATTEVFYLPIHVVYKSTSTATKVRAVFDASAKSSSGVSLNATVLVGPTVHPPLIDVLLRFRLHRIALTTDVSCTEPLSWPSLTKICIASFGDPKVEDTLKDYRMTRVTFGVLSSSFASNMVVKQNAIDFGNEYPLAAEAVEKSFYVDDGLAGADDVETAITLQSQLQELFSRGGFLLRKWNSSEASVLPKHSARTAGVTRCAPHH